MAQISFSEADKPWVVKKLPPSVETEGSLLSIHGPAIRPYPVILSLFGSSTLLAPELNQQVKITGFFINNASKRLRTTTINNKKITIKYFNVICVLRHYVERN
jgi:hypothetical protein